MDNCATVAAGVHRYEMSGGQFQDGQTSAKGPLVVEKDSSLASVDVARVPTPPGLAVEIRRISER